jgi:hypothetical protein
MQSYNPEWHCRIFQVDIILELKTIFQVVIIQELETTLVQNASNSSFYRFLIEACENL